MNLIGFWGEGGGISFYLTVADERGQNKDFSPVTSGRATFTNQSFRLTLIWLFRNNLGGGGLWAAGAKLG